MSMRRALFISQSGDDADALKQAAAESFSREVGSCAPEAVGVDRAQLTTSKTEATP